MRFCFVHAADLHLDTPFKGIGELDANVAAALRDASLDAFDNLVELAIQRNAAFVVLAGDIYDGPERGVRAQLRFLRGLEQMGDHGIRSFVVHGNHDPVESGWSAIRDWPEQVTVFGCEEVEEVTVEWEGSDVATVHGISFAQREETENLARRFQRGDGPGIHVGVLHANVGGNEDHDPYAPCTLDDLKETGLDYWALGHIHQRQVLHEGDPWVVYPGNLQGRSPKPSEQGPKGAYVIEVDGVTILEPEFVALDEVRFEQLEVDVGDVDIPALERALFEKGTERLAASDGRSLLLRCVLTGSGSIHRDLARQAALDQVLEDMRQETADDVPFLWWESLIDQTVPSLDMEAIRARGDFSAALLVLADEIAGSREALSTFTENALADLPMLRLDRLGVDVPDAGDDDRWSDAVVLAAELLEGGET